MPRPTFGSIIRNNLLGLLAAAAGLAAALLGNPAVFLFAFACRGPAQLNLVLRLAHLGCGPADVGAPPYFLSMLLGLSIRVGACSGLLFFAGGFGNRP